LQIQKKECIFAAVTPILWGLCRCGVAYMSYSLIVAHGQQW